MLSQVLNCDAERCYGRMFWQFRKLNFSKRSESDWFVNWNFLVGYTVAYVGLRGFYFTSSFLFSMTHCIWRWLLLIWSLGKCLNIPPGPSVELNWIVLQQFANKQKEWRQIYIYWRTSSKGQYNMLMRSQTPITLAGHETGQSRWPTRSARMSGVEDWYRFSSHISVWEVHFLQTWNNTIQCYWLD